MCGDCNDPFHDMDDDLDSAHVVADVEADRKLADLQVERATTYAEKCPKCNGRGHWRPGYPCFKCKGVGKLEFKTSPDERARYAQKRVLAADEKRVKLQAQRDAWIREYPEDFAWMNAKQETFEFARSMYDAFIQYGSLTPKQHETVTRLRKADAERTAARLAADAARIANAPVVNVDRITEAFTHAQAKGIKKPKMTLDGFKISLAPATGRNAGALYVVRKVDDQYLGKIMDGRFTRVRECDEATEAHVVRIIADPKGEAIAYGRRTGQCCICGRELTNHASIDAGIGPICAERFGWA